MTALFKQRGLSYHIAVQAAMTLMIMIGLSACTEGSSEQVTVHPVLVTTVHNLSGGYERTFTGVVRPRYESDLGFRTGGKVIARMVDVGQSVVSGQTLARLDPADYQLAAQAAENQLQAARIDAEQAASDEARFRRLLADNSVSTADHERQKARADATAARQSEASHQLDIALNRKKYATLTAEFDGIVTSIRFEAGQNVAQGQPIMTIANPSELEVVADLPEEMIGSVKSYTASASLWGSHELSIPLKLREISPMAAAQTRTFHVRFSISDSTPAIQQALHLDMTTKLHLSGKDREQAAALPATALWTNDGRTMVWQVNGNKLVAQSVEVIRYTNEAVLVRGVADGARVVTAGIQKLDAGMEVIPVERSASGINMDMPTVQAFRASAAGGPL